MNKPFSYDLDFDEEIDYNHVELSVKPKNYEEIKQTFYLDKIHMRLQDGKCWFSLTDVLRGLEVEEKDKHDVDPLLKGSTVINQITNGQTVDIFISETDLIKLVLHSNSPKSIAFGYWLTQEVEPYIVMKNMLEKFGVDADKLIAEMEAKEKNK